LKQTTLLSFFAALLFVSTAASGATIYQYQGNSFDQQQGAYGGLFTHLNISLKFDQALQPLSQYSYDSGLPGPALLDWQMSDGLFSVGPASSDLLFQCIVITDAAGRISMWVITARTADPSGAALTNSSTPIMDVAALTYPSETPESFGAIVANSPGVWSVAVPEPGSFALLLSGLAGALALGGYRGLRRRAALRG
jgi:hypothetical protein